MEKIFHFKNLYTIIFILQNMECGVHFLFNKEVLEKENV